MPSTEHQLRIGTRSDTRAPVILLIPPLFDEANRLRRTLVLTMRALAALGCESWLPDLPGQNESLVVTEAVTLADWRDALAGLVAAEAAPVVVASWRGGALIDDAAASAIGWWRMAPLAGPSLVKTMIRSRLASDREMGRATDIAAIRAEAQSGYAELAGHRLSGAMLAALEEAMPAPVAPLRQTTLGQGEHTLAGRPLWLHAEPSEDAAMAAAMARDLAKWTRACAAN